MPQPGDTMVFGAPPVAANSLAVAGTEPSTQTFLQRLDSAKTADDVDDLIHQAGFDGGMLGKSPQRLLHDWESFKQDGTDIRGKALQFGDFPQAMQPFIARYYQLKGK